MQTARASGSLRIEAVGSRKRFQIAGDVLSVTRSVDAEIDSRDLPVRIDQEGVAPRELHEAEVSQRSVPRCNFAFSISQKNERELVFTRELRVAVAAVDAYATHSRSTR